jgi:hypothetical protein
MPLQNRVQPTGDILAHPARGLFMGNRGGCFHRDDQTLKDRRWTSRRWIVCVLIFKDRRRALMLEGKAELSIDEWRMGRLHDRLMAEAENTGDRA